VTTSEQFVERLTDALLRKVKERQGQELDSEQVFLVTKIDELAKKILD
jgi:hypothetical protein